MPKERESEGGRGKRRGGRREGGREGGREGEAERRIVERETGEGQRERRGGGGLVSGEEREFVHVQS